MTDLQFKELSGRIDGVAHVLMTLICQLEDNHTLDGARTDQLLRAHAEARSKAGFEKCAEVVEQIANQLRSARENRSLAH